MDKYSSEEYQNYGLERIKNSPYHNHQRLKTLSSTNELDSTSRLEVQEVQQVQEEDADIKTGNSEGAVSSRSE